MFRLEVLPAAHGDAIWIEYGDPRRPRRIVVDGGPAATYETGLHRRLLLLPAQDRRIDLLLVTHIDTDHIDGAIILLQAAEQLGISFGEIWFNGWAQLAKEKQQDRRCSRRGRISGRPWRPKLTDSTAPMAPECQSFLDNVVAQRHSNRRIAAVDHAVAIEPVSRECLARSSSNRNFPSLRIAPNWRGATSCLKLRDERTRSAAFVSVHISFPGNGD